MNGKEKNGIEKISFILSKYMNMEFEKIIEIYNLIKANRLEARCKNKVVSLFSIGGGLDLGFKASWIWYHLGYR